jgi:hypothetical protein
VYTVQNLKGASSDLFRAWNQVKLTRASEKRHPVVYHEQKLDHLGYHDQYSTIPAAVTGLLEQVPGEGYGFGRI